MAAMEPNMVVFDFGSHSFKAGYAYSFPSEEEPRLVRPSAVEVQPAASSSSAASIADAERIRPTVQRGQIASFEGLESLIHHSLYESLGWPLGGEGGNVVISEPMLTSRAERERLTQLMFEVFNVSGLFIQDQAVMSLYSIGKVTGCVVDIGHGKVDVSTVLDGQLCSSSVRRLPFAGQDLTAMTSELFASRPASSGGGTGSCTSSGTGSGTSCIRLDPRDRGAAEALKEMCAAVADSAAEYDALLLRGPTQPSAAAPRAGTPPPADVGGPASANAAVPGELRTYTLPDGQQVTVGTEGYQVGEALFRPELLLMPGGSSIIGGMGLAEAVIDCVQTPYEGITRRVALENMFVCGGGSSVQNVAQRLLKEVRALASPPSLNPALCPLPEYLPKHAARCAPWIGGAVVGRVVLNQGGFVTKHDYEESGPAAVHKRCS